MRLIPLTQGLFAQVDDHWFDYLTQWKWFAQKHRGTFYATRRTTIGPNKQGIVFMHRIIMDTPDNLDVDHIDHNGLNCLEENMRNCTNQQNAMNRVAVGKSIYKGVSFDIRKRKNKIAVYIEAKIKFDGKQIRIGRFKTEEEAAHAYDVKAKEHFGEFANLNFK
jgi:hypothetical protein